MNKIIKALSAKTLLEYKLLNPINQRIIINNKVNDIIKYQLEYIKKHNYHNFIGTINIHYLSPKDEYYLVDGQHRLEAIKILYNKYAHNYDYNIEFITVGSKEQLRENFNILNQNTPLPEFPTDIDKSIPEQTANYFQYTYPNVWNEKLRAQRPKIHFNHFQEALGIIVKELKIKTKEELIKLMEEKNKELSLRDYNVSDKMLNEAKSNKFYFGLFLHTSNNEFQYQWVNELINKEFKNIKEKIPKALRDDVWDKYLEDISATLCPVCNIRKIKNTNFEAGHILSEKENGKTNIDNLFPICSKCNKSMATKNMKDYVKKYYPKNYDNFIKLLN
jgi:5-methylcytosine-specific restriction endonuclease McrA